LARATSLFLALALALGTGSATAAAPVETYGLVVLIDGAHATSVFPTITGAGIPSVLTGRVNGRHGIPSLYFFDRETIRYPILYVLGEAFDWNQWLSKDVKTIWEHYPGEGLALTTALNRGAAEKINILWNLGYKVPEYRAKLKIWRREAERFIFGGKPARITVAYNGWFDHMEHTTGSSYEQVGKEYDGIDAFVGEAIEVFVEKMRSRKRQVPGTTIEYHVALVSDHGHQDVREVQSINNYLEGMKVQNLQKDWRSIFGQKLSGSLPDDYEDHDVLVAAGEGHALIYFPTPTVDGEGKVTGRDWHHAPSLEQLRRFPFQGQEIDVVDLAVKEPAVSFMVGKDRASGAVHVYGGAGEARITREGDGSPTRARYSYEVVRGEDPLGYARDPRAGRLVNTGFHHADLWQRASVHTEYPDAVVMVHQSFDDPKRSPDFYLSAAPYVSLGDAVDGAKSASKHGGLTKEESWATLAFHSGRLAGASDEPRTMLTPGSIPTARVVDMVPTMLHMMGTAYDPAEVDGRVLPELAAMVTPELLASPDTEPVRPSRRADGLSRAPVPRYRGGVALTTSDADGAAELARIERLSGDARRRALRTLAASPPHRYRTATSVRQRARELYLTEGATPWLQAVRAKAAANPATDGGLVDRIEIDREEIARVKHETWRDLLKDLEAAELGPDPLAPAKLDRMFGDHPEAKAAFDRLIARVELELTAFEAWKSAGLVVDSRSRKKQEFLALNPKWEDGQRRSGMVAQLLQDFLEVAYGVGEAPTPTAPRSGDPSRDGYRDLTGG
jgi:hypothetical protein